MTQYTPARRFVGPYVALAVLTCAVAAAISAAVAAPASGEAHLDRTKVEQIGRRVRESVDKKEIAGAVVLVGTRDGGSHIEAVGKSDVENDTPMATDAMFWIASMTKPITATAIMMLQDEGKLSVEDKVSKYVPELGKLKAPDGKPANLTLRHLLTHTSGMNEPTPEEARAAKTLAELVPTFASKPLKFQPGSKWEYCQSGINTLGRIVEVVSGKDLETFFQERIFQPLGMKDTTFYPEAGQKGRIATSYKKTGDKLERTEVFFLNGKDVTSRDRYPAANGGLYSTAADYSRFCRMILNGGSLNGKQLLKPETVKQMTSVQTPESIATGFTPGNGWGLGWCVVRHPQGVTATLSPGTFGHGGAYGTQAWIDPQRGVFYVLMTQRANFPNSDASDLRKAFQEAAAAATGG
jgi:CubicO group peptidase (beta-lactamase class C family)